MEEKPSASSWDELIKEIGAAPPPDALERKRPAIETEFQPPPTAAPPKRKAGDWNALADKLGIDVPDEPEPPRPSAKTPASEYHGPSSEALEASFAEIEPLSMDFEEIIEEEVSEIDFEEDDGFVEEPAAEDDQQSLSGEAARNAFEALFDAGSFSALPPAAKPERKPEDRPRGPRWREPDAGRRRERDEEDKPHVSDADEPTTLEGEARESDDQGERPRRRRRRRGGRGRERERPSGAESTARGGQSDDLEAEDWSEPVQGEEGAEPSEAGPESGEEKPRRRRVRRRRRRALGDRTDEPGTEAGVNGRSAPTDAEDDEEEDDEASAGEEAEDDGDDEDGDSIRSSHKNIPTWSEAIGVMVETNMQSRKNSPQRPSSSRDRERGGRGRGRGRGGPRRGKS